MTREEERSRIFISYRREDSAGHVLALIPRLRQHFGADRIFKDTDSITPGQDFVSTIEQELNSCSVLLAIIGREWLTVSDARLGRRRLDLPEDFLRQEVATALASKKILVIPVLVGRATMPTAKDLPPDLVALARRNAVELSDTRWDSDLDRLIGAIEKAAGAPTQAPAANKWPSDVTPSVKPVARASQGRELLEARRQRQIQQHINAAREAFAAGDFEAVLTACDSALWLDPQEPKGLELSEQARSALDQKKVMALLSEARDKLGEDALGAASELIDQALLLDPSLDEAVELRQELLRIRAEQGRERERSRLLAAAIERMRASFDEDDFEGAIEYAEDALALRADSPEALRLRVAAHEAIEERKRQRDAKRQGQQVDSEARRESSQLREEEERLARERAEEEKISTAAGVAAEQRAAADRIPSEEQAAPRAARSDILRDSQQLRRSDENRSFARRPVALGGFIVIGLAAVAFFWFVGRPTSDTASTQNPAMASSSADEPAVALPSAKSAVGQRYGDAAGVTISGATASGNTILAVTPADTNKRTADAKKQESRAKDLIRVARQQLENGRDAEALLSADEALRADPRNAAVQSLLDGMLRKASETVGFARYLAEKNGAASDARDQYTRAVQRVSLSAAQNQAGQKVLAIRSLWEANQEFTGAAVEAKRVVDDRRRSAAISQAETPPAPVSTAVKHPDRPAAAIEATNRPNLEETIRGASRSCVEALASRNVRRLSGLYVGSTSQENENLTRLRDLMNRSEAQFTVMGQPSMLPPEVRGESATQNVRMRVGWKRFSGQKRDEVLQVRSAVTTTGGGASCKIVGSAGLK